MYVLSDDEQILARAKTGIGIRAPLGAAIRTLTELVTPSDRDYLPPDKRLLHVVADRNRWQAVLDEARRRARDHGENLSATGTEAA